MALSSSSDIARHLTGCADSSAFAEVIADYFADRMSDNESDHEMDFDDDFLGECIHKYAYYIV